MFFEIEMTRNVVVSPDGLHSGLLLQRSIILQLIEDISRIQATEENGYLVAVTTLEGRGEGKIREMTGSVVFPVKFKCIVFKPFKNEILEGGIEVVMKTGVHVTCGPMAEVFIPSQKMTDFEFIPGENPIFRNKQSSNVEKGGKIRFKILAIKWLEQRRVFQALGSLEGDFLGPIFDPEICNEMDSESPKMNAGGDYENPTANPENNNENPSKNADINPEHLQANPDLNHETNSEMNPQKDTDAVDPQTSPECLQRNSEMNLETNSEKDPQQNSELRTETMNPVINLVDLETMNPVINLVDLEAISETNQSQNAEMNTNLVDLETISETNQSQNAEMNTETMNFKTSLEQLQAYFEMDVQQISDTEKLSSDTNLEHP
uniref:DNA-directed RNA polymerase IV seventh largest subunit n=1 Tax=Pinus canariensis TaxID=49510 RepID=A0A0C4W290_9CONI|nr:DNA-directed RNA polymerase IV seventh largest subunit [Pinus canariensis]